MRRILAGSVGIALGLGTLRGYAQEAPWQQTASTAPRQPAVTLGPPTVALGAPRGLPVPTGAVQQMSLTWTSPSRVVRAQSDDKSPMPQGQPQPGTTPSTTSPLPPPTPMGPTVQGQGMPLVSGPFLTNPELGGPVYSGPVMSGQPMPGNFGSPCATCDPSFAPLPGGVFAPDSHACGYLVYGSAEYLLWVTRDAHLPTLLISGTAQPNFNIGTPVTLFGDDSITGQNRSGGRFTLGSWFNRCQNWGVESTVFFLGDRTNSAAFADSGTGVLARPFLNPDGTPNSELIAFPGLSSGTFTATTSNSLWGAEVNLRKNLLIGCSGKLDMLAGFRYVQFDEDIKLNETFTGLPGGQFAGVNGMIQDSFAVKNNFYGGQIGLNGELRRGPWSLNMTTKVALGTTRQTVDIMGTQTITATSANAVPGTFPGLLAQPSNIGSHSHDSFSVVPEIGFNVGWQATNHLKLFVGYNFLYWSNILRAGDQIDPVVAVVPSRINGNPVAPLVQPAGATRPLVPFKETDFWAQGVNLGLQWTW